MDAEATRIRLKKHAPAHGMEVGRVKVVMPGDGGHHVGLFWPHAGTLEWSKTQCLSLDVQGDPWEPMAVSQHPLLDWRLPPGVAMKLEPRQPLLVQTHYFKSSVGKRKARKWEPKTELYPVDPRTVTAHAGTLVLNDRVTDLPRGVRSRPAAAPSPERGPTLASFGSSPSGGHYHFRGSAIEAHRVKADGSLGELLYSFDGFDQPDFRQYSDNPIVLHPGEGIEWRCAYYNYIPSITREHCLLFGAYYPTETPQEAIHCVHDPTRG